MLYDNRDAGLGPAAYWHPTDLRTPRIFSGGYKICIKKND